MPHGHHEVEGSLVAVAGSIALHDVGPVGGSRIGPPRNGHVVVTVEIENLLEVVSQMQKPAVPAKLSKLKLKKLRELEKTLKVRLVAYK